MTTGMIMGITTIMVTAIIMIMRTITVTRHMSTDKRAHREQASTS